MTEVADKTLTLRQTNVAARRRRILDSARDLIGRDGIEGLSMRKLGVAAGLSVTTLYNQFGSRNDILQHLVDELMNGIGNAVTSAPLSKDPVERCYEVMTRSWHYIVSNESVTRPILKVVFHGGPELHPERFRIPEQGIAIIRLGIEAGMADGTFDDTFDPNVLAAEVYTSYEPACAQWVDGRISAREFEARLLYAMNVVLTLVARPALRKKLLGELLALEKRLPRTSRGPLATARR